MPEHAYFNSLPHERPWDLEDQLIELLDLPLNLDGNTYNAFHADLTEVRKLAETAANSLPVVANPGVGGR